MTKRIAYVYNGELDFGGVEAHLLSIFRHLDKNRYSPILISPTSERYREKAVETGVMVIPIPPLKPLDLKAIWQLFHIFRQEKIDLVHVHSPIAAISARIAAKILRLPVIVTVHSPSTRFYGNLLTFKAKTGRRIYIAIDRILNDTMTTRLVYVSSTIYGESIQNQLSPEGISTIIPNGIDLTEYAQKSKSPGIRNKLATEPTATVFCIAGRLSAEKGIDLLLDSIEELIKAHPQRNLKLWIIGDGPLKGELVERTKFLGLEELVIFTGFQERISEYLQASDIFILPSRHEGMSIVLLEALACGLPCVVTDVGENAEVIADGIEGIVVPPEQVKDLTKALDLLLTDHSLRDKMSAKALERSRNFSDQRMVGSLQKLYLEILQE